MWYKNLGGTFVRFVTIHACDGRTDGHPCDRKDRPAYMQRGKKTTQQDCLSIEVRPPANRIYRHAFLFP